MPKEVSVTTDAKSACVADTMAADTMVADTMVADTMVADTMAADRRSACAIVADSPASCAKPAESRSACAIVADKSQVARGSWLTDTLHTIIERALSADKPDIKGALAALAMLADRDETAATSTDIAAVIREARKRAADATEGD